MKLNSLSVLCLSLILFHAHSSLAKRAGGSFGKGFSSKKIPSWNRGNTNTGSKNNQGSSSRGGYPKQSGQNNQGGHPPQSGRPAYPGSYPRQQGGVGYPAHGSPYGRGYGGYGGYPGGYINQNPNNKILSPHYGGSFGYGGHGVGGGSPFSHSVQGMGVYPQDRSRGFGRSAVVAAAGGAMAGMALGYGLGRFPRPHFPFHSPQEEYYYNHYMYRRYGVRSTDADDYGRDYRYSQPPQTYDSFMDSCMKRTDILPVENRKPKLNPAATATTTANSTATTTAAVVTSAPDTVTDNKTSDTNSTAEDNSSTPSPSTPHAPNQPEARPGPPASQAVGDDEEEDDDTVSIMEIGYPALIKQVKARRCLELYMIYSERYMKRETGGAEGLEMGYRGSLAVVTSALLMLLNSNMLTLLH
ncbi:uncharacterized protein LOC117767390 [Hippoglossus hippoglossus]|uniref:uncharacterized protein LOC117767390 n=1 Tax=Hippoglossus hippoglossus TaxID=8267 RepID=UPI00148E2CAC|nr:uncharacterized protein LOC117767390 [Hippoglossus hippoglossus]